MTETIFVLLAIDTNPDPAVEHLVHSGGRSFRHADWWATPVRHQPVARTYAEAFAAAETDHDQRAAIKERGAA